MNKKHSCGAILYTILNNKLYIVLGLEKNIWLPFKGVKENYETYEEAAIREIREETCGLLKINSISLDCSFSTKRKNYHIGLCEIKYDDINKFNKQIFYYNKKLLYNKKYSVFLEKTNIKLFPLDTIFENNFHIISSIPIKHYYSTLQKINKEYQI
jgi:hypothetical protein